MARSCYQWRVDEEYQDGGVIVRRLTLARHMLHLPPDRRPSRTWRQTLEKDCRKWVAVVVFAEWLVIGVGGKASSPNRPTPERVQEKVWSVVFICTALRNDGPTLYKTGCDVSVSNSVCCSGMCTSQYETRAEVALTVATWTGRTVWLWSVSTLAGRVVSPLTSTVKTLKCSTLPLTVKPAPDSWCLYIRLSMGS